MRFLSNFLIRVLMPFFFFIHVDILFRNQPYMNVFCSVSQGPRMLGKLRHSVLQTSSNREFLELM